MQEKIDKSEYPHTIGNVSPYTDWEGGNKDENGGEKAEEIGATDAQNGGRDVHDGGKKQHRAGTAGSHTGTKQDDNFGAKMFGGRAFGAKFDRKLVCEVIRRIEEIGVNMDTVCRFVCMCMHACACVCMYVCACVCIYVCM